MIQFMCTGCMCTLTHGSCDCCLLGNHWVAGTVEAVWQVRLWPDQYYCHVWAYRSPDSNPPIFCLLVFQLATKQIAVTLQKVVIPKVNVFIVCIIYVVTLQLA